MCLDLCPPVYFQFSCHVCFQVSDTLLYLIAISDEYFNVQKSKALNCRGTFLTACGVGLLDRLSTRGREGDGVVDPILGRTAGNEKS